MVKSQLLAGRLDERLNLSFVGDIRLVDDHLGSVRGDLCLQGIEGFCSSSCKSHMDTFLAQSSSHSSTDS
ncbi:hypothetical protein PoMZ_07847 [Pyricularia oryzae]|uniref:Uncharacterized protein n=1 Tax=Pyricularia oryzae TaxID=318829 RepID=A0A4P7NG86_PYROR|nr:hypothetical protein PoMZ_07847 [Pyricularia oryzae]